ncbi:MAG: MgtC/SapB family protein [Bacteriovoracia bacterium]
MITHFEMIARIATGAALGGVIGFERDIHGRQAGLRTHVIVAMASATFMVISNHFAFFQGYDAARHVEADVSRIAASVVSGIGFLAGGAILKTGATIQGLTTAAGLWLVAAIGLCAGGGMYVEGVAVTAMGLIALTVFRLFEDKNDKLIRRHVSLQMEDEPNCISKIMDALTASGVKVPDFDYEKKIESKTLGLTFDVRIPVNIGVRGLIELLEKQSGVRHVHIKLRD